MNKMGENVSFWGVEEDGLTWFSSNVMRGQIKLSRYDHRRKEWEFEIQNESGGVSRVSKRLVEQIR